jgi:uncharacterized repeat protein (TIGR01451 family)
VLQIDSPIRTRALLVAKKEQLMNTNQRFSIPRSAWLGLLAIAIGLAVMAALPVFAASTPGDVPELIYYKFDNAGGSTVFNYASAPVGTNPAPLMGGLTIGGTGEFGSALVGTGASANTDYVNTGWATNLGTSSWTISLWLNNVPSTTSTFYMFGDVNAGGLRSFTGGVAGANGLILRGPMTDVLITGAFTGQPAVVHFVYDSTVPEIRGYLNGTLQTTVAQSALNINGTGPFKVGGYSSSASLPAGALLDEFRLYNRALSAQEIVDTWNKSLPLVRPSITKSVSTTSANPGEVITYTLAFSNTGSITATNVVITDTLSAVITGTNYITSGVALTQVPGSQYEWNVPDLAQDQGGVITITGTLVKPLAAGVYTNTAIMGASGITQTTEITFTVPNVAPVANAGLDQSTGLSQTVTLDGSGSSDDNGDALTYGWTQTGGPPVALSSATAISPTFTAPSADAVLTFTLALTDSFGLADPTPDEVVVTVTAARPGYASTPAAGNTINVGEVNVGRPITATLTISETGDAPLEVTGHTLSGANAADFSVSPATLSIADGGAPQILYIRCTPSAYGPRAATLTINHNAAGSPAIYSLSCVGINRVYFPGIMR